MSTQLMTYLVLDAWILGDSIMSYLFVLAFNAVYVHVRPAGVWLILHWLIWNPMSLRSTQLIVGWVRFWRMMRPTHSPLIEYVTFWLSPTHLLLTNSHNTKTRRFLCRLCKCVCVCACVCVSLCVRETLCARACTRERERERERLCVRMCVGLCLCTYVCAPAPPH